MNIAIKFFTYLLSTTAVLILSTSQIIPLNERKIELLVAYRLDDNCKTFLYNKLSYNNLFLKQIEKHETEISDALLQKYTIEVVAGYLDYIRIDTKLKRNFTAYNIVELSPKFVKYNDISNSVVTSKWLKFLNMEILSFNSFELADKFFSVLQTLPCVDLVATAYDPLNTGVTWNTTDIIDFNLTDFDEDNYLHSFNNLRGGSKLINFIKPQECVVDNNICFTDIKEKEKVKTNESDIEKLKTLNAQYNSTYTRSSLKTKDPLFIYQKCFYESIQITKLWNTVLDLERHKIPIALLDSGCDFQDPDMKDAYFKNPNEDCHNGVDDDLNGYIDDCYGFDFSRHYYDASAKNPHGAYIANLMAARGNNHIGGAGVCWHCQVMCLKVSDRYLSMTAIAEAFNYALSFGIKIFNFSFSGFQNQIFDRLYRAAEEYDILIAVAAGNSVCDLDSNNQCVKESYPALYKAKHMFVVGASNCADKLAEFTNYGDKTVEIYAPGENIILPAKRSKSAFAEVVSGTSFSSPIVAAAAALLYSIFPKTSMELIKLILIHSCRGFNNILHESDHGLNIYFENSNTIICRGIVDMEYAYKLAQNIFN